MSTDDPTRVHVRDRDGGLKFTRLIDTGGDRLEFESRTGWLNRRDLAPNGWSVHPGWPLTPAHAAQLAGRRFDPFSPELGPPSQS